MRLAASPATQMRANELQRMGRMKPRILEGFVRFRVASEGFRCFRRFKVPGFRVYGPRFWCFLLAAAVVVMAAVVVAVGR